MNILIKPSDTYAVFESCGEDWEQITVWLPADKVVKFLEHFTNLNTHKHYSIMNCVEITYE